MDDGDAERRALIASVGAHERELQAALDDVRRAVRHTVAVGERIAENPVPWLVGALLAGLWLGRRGD